MFQVVSPDLLLAPAQPPNDALRQAEMKPVNSFNRGLRRLRGWGRGVEIHFLIREIRGQVSEFVQGIRTMSFSGKYEFTGLMLLMRPVNR